MAMVGHSKEKFVASSDRYSPVLGGGRARLRRAVIPAHGLGTFVACRFYAPILGGLVVISKRSPIAACIGLAAVTLWPSQALAQWHGHGGHGHSAVVVGAGFVYNPFFFYSPFYWGGWYPGFGWGPYPFYGPYGYGYGYGSYGYGPAVSEARLQVKPNDAEVFVDGYFVGRVDSFDGVFQRLDSSSWRTRHSHLPRWLSHLPPEEPVPTWGGLQDPGGTSNLWLPARLRSRGRNRRRLRQPPGPRTNNPRLTDNPRLTALARRVDGLYRCLSAEAASTQRALDSAR